MLKIREMEEKRIKASEIPTGQVFRGRMKGGSRSDTLFIRTINPGVKELAVIMGLQSFSTWGPDCIVFGYEPVDAELVIK